jgi:hypothetical protein
MEEQRVMCTVSWIRTSVGYQLFCNRDELRTRLPGVAPRLQQRHGVHYIAPLDGNHGGSWIAVNEYGMAFCLLNRYRSTEPPGRGENPYRSRGLLLLDLVGCRCLAEVWKKIRSLQLREYPPFALVVLGYQLPAMLMDWCGRYLRLDDNADQAVPLVSSSFDQEGAQTSRKMLFAQLAAKRGLADSKLLHTFHTSHLPLKGPYSPCMHRSDASTVSFSRISVSDGRVEFSYLPGAPCGLPGTNDPGHNAKTFQTVRLPTPNKLKLNSRFAKPQTNWRCPNKLASSIE